MAPRTTTGSSATRPLLFERLVDAGPDAPAQSGGYAGSADRRSNARTEVEASVAREIAALLSTRIDPKIDAIEPRDRTVLDYGLPDITGLAAVSETDRQRIARAVERAITAFEPRLARPRVSVLLNETQRDKLALAIAGTLTVNAVPETFAFAVDLSGVTEEGR